jgi:molybdenum cofactor guanylyltransferase
VTRILGAVLAGGQSRRFGSDKALAIWQGRTLLDWAITALMPHVEQVILCGREDGIPDRPAGGLGPLAGLNAALHHGRDRGCQAVLSLACDTPIVDPLLLEALCRSGSAAYVEQTPVIGLWPCALADRLDAQLKGEDRSMRAWVRCIGAQPILSPAPIANINRPADLAHLRA